MARAALSKELHVEARNETGLLGMVVSALAQEAVYIVHLCAYSVSERGYLQLVVREEDLEKARKALSLYVDSVEERDVVIVEFENKTGTLSPVAKVLGNHDIFIDYVYGTSGDGFKIVGVFSTTDNVKAVEVINAETGHAGV